MVIEIEVPDGLEVLQNLYEMAKAYPGWATAVGVAMWYVVAGWFIRRDVTAHNAGLSEEDRRSVGGDNTVDAFGMWALSPALALLLVGALVLSVPLWILSCGLTRPFWEWTGMWTALWETLKKPGTSPETEKTS